MGELQQMQIRMGEMTSERNDFKLYRKQVKIYMSQFKTYSRLVITYSMHLLVFVFFFNWGESLICLLGMNKSQVGDSKFIW